MLIYLGAFAVSVGIAAYGDLFFHPVSKRQTLDNIY